MTLNLFVKQMMEEFQKETFLVIKGTLLLMPGRHVKPYSHARETCREEFCGMRPWRIEDQHAYKVGYEAAMEKIRQAKRFKPRLVDGEILFFADDEGAWLLREYLLD